MDFEFGANGEYISLDRPPYSIEGVRCLFLGASGAGKSNFLALAAEQFVKNSVPVVFVDINAAEQDGGLPDILPYRETDGLAKMATGDYDGLAMYVAFVGNIYHRVSMASDFFARYSDIVALWRKPHVLIIDDVDYVAPRKPSYDGQKDMATGMADLIYNARKFGVNIFSASNAASRVLPYWVEQQNIRMFGMTTSKSDWSVYKTYLPPSFTIDDFINLHTGEVHISSKRVSRQAVRILCRNTEPGGYTPQWGSDAAA